jgi:hypothetical protein
LREREAELNKIVLTRETEAERQARIDRDTSLLWDLSDLDFAARERLTAIRERDGVAAYAIAVGEARRAAGQTV